MTNSTRDRSDETTATAELAKAAEATKAAAEKKPLLGLSLTQIAGGALAAMTAAALGSTVGLAGTIIGAAFASIVAGVAGALYTTSLRHTRDRMRTVFVGRGAASTAVVVEEAEPAVSVAPGRRRFPWRPALAVTLAVFALAAIAITGVEAVTGRTLSGGQGTTIQQVGGGAPASDPDAQPSPQASATSTPEPDASPTAEPSATPSPAATPAAPESASATAEPSATVLPDPGATQAPADGEPVPSAPVS